MSETLDERWGQWSGYTSLYGFERSAFFIVVPLLTFMVTWAVLLTWGQP